MTLEELQKALKVEFRNIDFLERSITHSSYVHEKKMSLDKSNERLEFLGDSVLNLCIAEFLVKFFPEEPEGALSKRRALLVNQKQLAQLSNELKLGSVLRLGKGEEKTGGRTKESILADVFESVIGAIYLDQGLDAAKDYLFKLFSPLFERVKSLEASEDFKTRLQEFLQKNFQKSPRYSVVHESGPDHQKIFEVQIDFGGRALGCGQGRSKREAEQAAAQVALTAVKEEDFKKWAKSKKSKK